MPATTSRRGFTLTEMLIVIAIIATLMALLIPAIGIAQENSRKAQTTTTINKMQAGIEKFRQLNSTIPERAYDPMTDEGYRNLMTWDDEDPGDSTDLALQTDELQTNNRTLLKDLKSADEENWNNAKWVNKNGLIIDSWDKPIIYRPFATYPLLTGSVPPVHGETPPRPDSYQIWSFGPDRKNQHGETKGKADDINNWSH